MSARPGILEDRRWVGLVILVGLALGQAVTMIVTAFATRAVFIHLRDGSGTEAPFAALVAIGLVGAALFALRSLEGRVAERTGQGYAADIRKALFKHMTRMPTSEIARRRSGALALRYVGDLTAFKGWVSRGLARLISASITIPAAFLTLYLLEPWFFVGSFLPIFAVMIGIFWMSRPLGEAHSDLRGRRARLAAAMAERLPQGIALRRSGRINTELKMLSRRSDQIIDAAVRRASLAATVRALPDAGSGVASAICLFICVHLGLGVPDAVAALTALALVVWPLRHLADVSDRRRAYVVASDKLDAMMAAPRLPLAKKTEPEPDALPVRIRAAQLPGVRPVDIALQPGEICRLDGPAGCGKSTLLLMLAGFEQPAEAEGFHVLGVDPVAVPTGRVLYLGRHAPQLKGSLRREATMGIGRSPSDSEIEKALTEAGLSDLAGRIGGPDGKISEGRRNLTSSERVRLHVARGLLSLTDLALIDADEIGLDADALHTLLDHFEDTGTAALVVTSDASADRRLEQMIEMQPKDHPTESSRKFAAE
ncbi:MAG: ABC transporter ATP-binding protein [Pseudomonadota bacterium]